MILSRTPFRISFFGGGTDYPVWFNEHGGAVLATTIDKYCYVSCRYLPPFFDHRYRIVYSLIEHVKTIDEISHPSVRECLRFMKTLKGVEIHHDGDLPAKTGLGSSSSFTVGMLNSLYALNGKMASKMHLAQDAIHVEQKMIRENVGCQDQILAAFGGFNLIEFSPGQKFTIAPVTVSPERLDNLSSHLMLVYTGLSRFASQVASKLIKSAPNKKKELKAMHGMVFDALKILNGNGSLDDFGKLLHESWKIKKSLADNISTSLIDEIYEIAHKNGALGGKILGAGGGGFLLLFVKPERQALIKSKLKKFLHVPFRFENAGSQVVFYKADENE